MHAAQFEDPDVRRFNLVTLDFLAHGLTEGKVPAGYGQTDAATDLAAFMVRCPSSLRSTSAPSRPDLSTTPGRSRAPAVHRVRGVHGDDYWAATRAVIPAQGLRAVLGFASGHGRGDTTRHVTLCADAWEACRRGRW